MNHQFQHFQHFIIKYIFNFMDITLISLKFICDILLKIIGQTQKLYSKYHIFLGGSGQIYFSTCQSAQETL